MTSNLLYAIGVLCCWAGVLCLLSALKASSTRVALLISGGLFFLIAATTPIFQGGFGIPLVWFIMPFAAWGSVVCVAIVVVQILRGLAGKWIDYAKSITISVAIGLLFVGLYRSDATNRVEIIRGHIALNGLQGASCLALAFAAMLAMIAIGRRGKKFATYSALAIGSVIFGLPFCWLLLTSFKEERDISSASGLVWIPRVEVTVPYFDPESPLLEGSYKGDWIQASVLKSTFDSYTVEIQRPSSLRGVSFTQNKAKFKVVAKDAPMVQGDGFTGFVARELNDGRRMVHFVTPDSRKGAEQAFLAADLQPIRKVGLRTMNYTEALEAMPPETKHGLLYLRNTLVIVILSVVGTLVSSSLVAYGFARLRFPGREIAFKILLGTMMLPGAVTLMPQFLLFRSLGWVDTLYPLWVPAFFASAFNVFLLRQFFSQIPSELEDASKIDGAGVLRTFWSIMIPQIKPALAVVAIWTFMGSWNNFMGPLLYINSPENMPLSYALQLFQSQRGGEPGLMMAFATLTIIPVLALFFFAQRYFIEGVTLSGLGGR